MNVKSEIKTYLLSLTSVTDLVGNRIHYRRLPQDAAYPQLMLHEVHGQRTRSLNGPAGQRELLVQLDIWTLGELDAGPVDEALRMALEGDIDTDPPWQTTGKIGAMVVQEIEYDDGVDTVVKPFHASQQEVFRTTREINLWIEE